MDMRIKICGLTQPGDVEAVAAAGVAYAGLVFFEKSPRRVTPEQACALATGMPVGLCKVALTVNADNTALDRIVDAVPLDMLQLHGRETPERVAEVKARYGLPVMKAVGVATADDLPALDAYGRVADQLLVDAKPAPGAALPAATAWPLTGGCWPGGAGRCRGCWPGG